MKQFITYRSLLLANTFIALVLLSAGCRRPSASPEPVRPTVTVASVHREDLVEWDEFTGHTVAAETVEVRPRVSGHLQEAGFQSGQLVKQGDILFTIDPRWHKAAFEQTAAELERAKVRLQNAEREAKRTAQLLASKAVSTEEAEARESRFLEARAALLAAEASRDTARLDLEHTAVRAPISGRVSRALVTPGNYVSGVPGAATMLTTIVSLDPIHVYADVDENSLLRLNALAAAKKSGRDASGIVPVELQLGDEDGFPHRGHIESYDNRLDPKTGSILLRAVIPNPEGRIVPGLFARIRIPGSAAYPAVLVDEHAIGTDQAHKFVLTLTETNTVAYRPVQLGPSVGGKRVIRSGLDAGERVVVAGLQRVRPGMPVTPQEQLAQAGKAIQTAQRSASASVSSGAN